MTNVINQNQVLQEIVNKLRSADVLTTTQRSVTTSTYTATLTSATTMTLPQITAKNIRSLTIAGTAKTYGADYTINFGNGTSTPLITFVTTQTGATTAVYDYGVDKIFPNYPRSDLTINSFPRIAVEFINASSENAGFGNVNQSKMDFTIVVYDFKKEDIRSYIAAVRSWLIDNMSGFNYLRVVKPTLISPIMLGNFSTTKDKVFQQSIDFKSILNLEKN